MAAAHCFEGSARHVSHATDAFVGFSEHTVVSHAFAQFVSHEQPVIAWYFFRLPSQSTPFAPFAYSAQVMHTFLIGGSSEDASAPASGKGMLPLEEDDDELLDEDEDDEEAPDDDEDEDDVASPLFG